VSGRAGPVLSVTIRQVVARGAAAGGAETEGEWAQPADRRPSANGSARGVTGRVQGSETTNGLPPSLALRLDAAVCAASRVEYSPTLTL